MVLILSRSFGVKLLKYKTNFTQTRLNSTGKLWFGSKKVFYRTLGLLATGTGIVIYTLDQAVKAGEMELHPPRFPWAYKGIITALDHASLRRGYEVYRQVCASCHSLKHVTFRELVGVTHTEAEAKAEAEQQMVEDGPNEEGNMFQRPGKLSDKFPPPYPNEEAARFANGGSYPLDLTYIILAREGGDNYIFSLLTGYCEPPAGVTLKEGLYYNPYFLGGSIAMAPPLFSESATYSDGTQAHASQLAKDVVTFLKWAGEPEFDDRKVMMVKCLGWFIVGSVISWYWYKMRFMSNKTRKFVYTGKSSTKKPECSDKCE
ncbi:unnamed protein product [Phyllotreta striolata]|uniref:Cytochrome c1 n=1 Tax=Phyllotreta striolata TaxID=444603 RepID=A0A9N9TIC1_PHYSR|nr:unnamed protein product [Phyllotreta striolata]